MSGASLRPILITGGAGFIGTNLADRLARDGQRVRILDNLARAGVDKNLNWLCATHGDRIDVAIADVRDSQAVGLAVAGAAAVYHLAAQVAVTTSLTAPAEDFEINARGTLNVLEALRAQPEPIPLMYTSTNKVYGRLDGIALTENDDCYLPVDPAVRKYGVSEDRCLQFYSPYGCSKGAADQYVLDYARIYGLRLMFFA